MDITGCYFATNTINIITKPMKYSKNVTNIYKYSGEMTVTLPFILG